MKIAPQLIPALAVLAFALGPVVVAQQPPAQEEPAQQEPAKQEPAKQEPAQQAPAPEAKPPVPSGPKIILLKPVLLFEDVRSDALLPTHAAMEPEYELHLLNAARKGVGAKLPVIEQDALDPAGAEACNQLQALSSRLARGNINDEIKESLGRLAALDEDQYVLVHFFRLKTGPGRSWDPNTGAITSKLESTLMQAALVSCKNGKVIWKGEQFFRKALKTTHPDFRKALTALYQDFDIK